MADAAWGSWEDCGRSHQYGRPPQHPGYLQTAVPSWEKRFCTSVCLIPWGRIVGAKITLGAYKNIAEWDDSAAFEAFQNAKSRYWAYINNLPCDIPLPDPDMYIEKVNHNVVIDPKLIEDLEKEQPPPLPDCKKEGSSGWESLIFENKQTPTTGWGNAWGGSTSGHHSVDWDQFVEEQRQSPGWGETNLSKHGDSSNTWNFHGSWGGQKDCSWGDGRNTNSWNNGRDHTWGQHSNFLNNNQGNNSDRKRSRGNYDSGFSKSRQANHCQANGSNWYGPRERNMQRYPYEKTTRGQQPMFTRQSKPRWACAPVNNQRSAESEAY